MDQQRILARGTAIALGTIAFILLVLPGLVRWGMLTSLDLGLDETTGITRLLGHVTSAEFVDLNPYVEPGGALDLTTIAMQEARPPESAPLDLSAHEGHLLIVAGHDGGGWLYQASVERDLGDGLGTSIALWAWQR